MCCPVFPADIVARKAEDRVAFMTLKPMPTSEMQNWGTVLFSVCVDDMEGVNNLTPEEKIVYKDAKRVTCPDYLASLPREMEDGRIHQLVRVWAYVPAEGCVSMDAVVQTAARLEDIADRHEHAVAQRNPALGKNANDCRLVLKSMNYEPQALAAMGATEAGESSHTPIAGELAGSPRCHGLRSEWL